jgi:Holliday junction resolvase RusA-like endonuclease
VVKRSKFLKDGSKQSFSTLAKTQSLVDYQSKMVLIVRSARPSGWKPEGWVRVHYAPFLVRHIDADNLLKAINDVIEWATGVDDKWYLPSFEEPVIGVAEKDARVEITVEG